MSLRDPIDPTKIIQIGGVAYPVLNKFFSLSVAANQSLVAGVAGQKVRVLGLIAQTNNAASGVLQFLDASGGTLMFSYVMPTNAQTPFVLPMVDPLSLVCETTAGNGLFATIITQAMLFNIYFIQYTP